MHTIRSLLPWEWPKLRDHLLRLDAADRRMRFGHALGDRGIETFVRHINWLQDRVCVAVDDGGAVIGAVHLSRLDDGAAELAFSVEAAHRGRGVGQALADRAILAARNGGYRRVHIFCLAENIAMRRLAARCGMRLACEATDCEGCQRLEPATPMSWLSEVIGEVAGLAAATAAFGRHGWRLLRPAPPSVAA